MNMFKIYIMNKFNTKKVQHMMDYTGKLTKEINQKL